MLLPVRHPAPVRYVPAGRRHERVAMVACETFAEIPEVSARAFVPMDVKIANTPLHMRGDQVWATVKWVSRHRYDDEWDWGFDRGDLAAWLLDGTGDVVGDDYLGHRLRRTPLVAAAAYEPGSPGPHDAFVRYGEPMPRSREVVHDTREAAAMAVQLMLRDEFAIVGDEVRIRVRPLAHVQPEGSVKPLTLHMHPHYRDEDGTNVGFGRIHKAFDALGTPSNARVSLDLANFRKALGEASHRSDDMAWLAVSSLYPIHHTLQALARTHKEELGAIERRMAFLSDLSMVGIMREDDVPEALDLLRMAVARMTPLMGRYAKRHSVRHVEMLARHLDGHILPDWNEIDPDDEASLLSLVA